LEKMTVEDWLSIRKGEGFKIDPSTAKVDWLYAQVLDLSGNY